MQTHQPQFQPAPPPSPGWAAAPPHLPILPPPPHVPTPPPAPGSGWAFALGVIAVVLAAVAAIGVFGVVVWLNAGGSATADGDEDESSWAWGPITGQVTVSDAALSGDALATTLRQVIRDDGGTTSDLRCPDTTAVRQNVTTVCHGVVDETDWALVVFFEDADGHFTLLPL